MREDFLVGGAGERVGAEFGAEGGCQVAADDVRAFGGEGEGCGPSDAAGGAGDDCDFVVEAAGHGG